MCFNKARQTEVKDISLQCSIPVNNSASHTSWRNLGCQHTRKQYKGVSICVCQRMVWNFQTMTSHYGSESITYQNCQTAIYCAQEGPSVPFLYIHLIPLYFKFWYILIGYIMQHIYCRYPGPVLKTWGSLEDLSLCISMDDLNRRLTL